MKVFTFASLLYSYTSEHTFPKKCSFSDDFHMAIIVLCPSSRSPGSPETAKRGMRDLNSGILKPKAFSLSAERGNPWQNI
jgi:hypothetical protein